MAYIEKTAFEVKNSNGIYNAMQNVAGKFGSFSGSTFTGAICSAGFIVEREKLVPMEGYEGITNPILNGNTYYMVQATDGSVDGFNGDHTGLFAANTYNVNQLVSADGAQKIDFGANTLGLSIPAGEIGDFTELIVGEKYKFGAGNFAATPTVGQYVTISNGLFSASNATSQADPGEVYGLVTKAEPFNEGASFWGTGYIVQILRATAVAG